VLYLVAWLLPGAAVVAAVVLLAGGRSPPAADLPPVRQIDLSQAARAAGCELRRGAARPPLAPRVDGPHGARPAAAAVHRAAPPVPALLAAMRRGIIVLHFRTDLVTDDQLRQLEALQRLVPRGSILTPDTTGMPYAVAATAHRRLLGCPRFSDRAIDAIRLFRGRHLGRRAA